MIGTPGRAAKALALLLLALAPAAASATEPPVRARSEKILAAYFSSDDYPPEALRKGEKGTVAFRLTIGPDGRPAGCSVTASSGSTSLDSTTCRLIMERTSFQPARDSNGKAMSDTYHGRIVWRLPDGGVMSRSEAAMTLWGVCLLGEAAKLALSDLSAEELVRRSYPPCAALEAVASSEIGNALESKRDEVAQAFEEMIFKARLVLKAPRPIPIPSSP